MKFFRIGALALAGLIALGCGDDEDKGQSAELNDAIAKQSVTSTVSAISSLKTSNNGLAAASSLMAAGTSGLAILNTGEAAGSVAAPFDVGTAQAACEGCDEATQACTFQDCDYGGATINGSISWTGDKLTCDLQFAQTVAGSTTYDIKCDLTVTETQIDGSFSLKGNMSMEGHSASFDVSTTYNAVTLANGQPSGGSVSVTAKVSSGDQSYSGSGTVSFP